MQREKIRDAKARGGRIARLAERIRAIQKVIAVLVVLCVAAVPMYFFTRAMATRNRAMHARVAAIWYEDGRESFQDGESTSALSVF
jgi:hypothetical protein